MKEFIFVVDQQFNNTNPLVFLSEKGVSDEILKKVKFGGIFINDEVLKNGFEFLASKEDVAAMSDRVVAATKNLVVVAK